MDVKKYLLAVVAYTIIFQVAYVVGAFADMPYYTDPALSGVWSKTMMPSNAAPPAEFFLLSLVATLASGAIFCYGFALVGSAFMSKGKFKADKPHVVGIKYGLFVFALIAPSQLAMPLLINVPFALAVSWVVQSLAGYAIAGAFAGKLLTKK